MTEYDSGYVWSQINRIDAKISNCEAAITNIEGVKNNCSSTKDDWYCDFDRLTSDQDIANIKNTNVFEGEMADKLSNEIPGVRGKIQSGISRAEALESELEWQVSYLQDAIADLYNKRWAWENQL